MRKILLFLSIALGLLILSAHPVVADEGKTDPITLPLSRWSPAYTENLILLLGKLGQGENQWVIPAKTTVSFNQRIGCLGVGCDWNGKQYNTLFVNGVPIPAGGACDVASFMMFAAARAGLQTSKDNTHAYPIAGVPREYWVNIWRYADGSGQDMKIHNPFDYPVTLKWEIKGNQLKIWAETGGNPLPQPQLSNPQQPHPTTNTGGGSLPPTEEEQRKIIEALKQVNIVVSSSTIEEATTQPTPTQPQPPVQPQVKNPTKQKKIPLPIIVGIVGLILLIFGNDLEKGIGVGAVIVSLFLFYQTLSTPPPTPTPNPSPIVQSIPPSPTPLPFRQAEEIVVTNVVLHIDQLPYEEQQYSGDCRLSPAWPESIQKWRSYICAYSEKNDIDPNWIAAIIYQESGGNPKAVSKSCAIGLMQVMPKDGRFSGGRCDLTNGSAQAYAATYRFVFRNRPTINKLFNPEFNIAWGTTYFAGLVRRHGGSISQALYYYGGPGYGQVYIDAVTAHYRRFAGSPSP